MLKVRTIGWDEVERITATLARQVLVYSHSPTQWRGVIAVARGGLIPATLVANHLCIRRIASIQATSYSDEPAAAGAAREVIQQSPIRLVGHADISHGGENWLVVDDLVDTGATFRGLRHILPWASYACLFAKPQGRVITDIYAEASAQDIWIHFPWEREWPNRY
jgi:xanthine phosphoribosyltransferase